MVPKRKKTKCPICNQRKGKRECSRKESLICSKCCGQIREPKKCPSNCPYNKSFDQKPSSKYRNFKAKKSDSITFEQFLDIALPEIEKTIPAASKLFASRGENYRILKEAITNTPRNFENLSTQVKPFIDQQARQQIIQDIEKIEAEEHEWEAIDKVNNSLENLFQSWLEENDIEVKIRNISGFVSMIFFDYIWHYEGTLETYPSFLRSFLCSHYIRKTHADPETYTFSPHALYLVLKFLLQNKIGKQQDTEESLKEFSDLTEQYYTYLLRYYDPDDQKIMEDLYEFGWGGGSSKDNHFSPQ